MKKISFISLAVVLMMAGLVSANSVWNPAGNGITPPAIGNWGITENWANGLPTESPDDGDPKAVFNLVDAAECIVDDVRNVGTIVMGDGGSEDPHNNVLRIVDGGHLTAGATSGWTGLGYNRDGGVMIVEKGGQFTNNAHLWFGMKSTGVGRLVLDGGTAIIADAFDLGRDAGGLGFVDLNSGILQARYFPDANFNEGSVMDIRYGTFILEGQSSGQDDRINNRINSGGIIAFGGLGTLNIDYIDGDTHITANNPMNPFPAMGETVPVGDVELSWTNVDPNTEGDPVFVDVWFGTEPNKPSENYTQVVTAGENTTSIIVSAPTVGQYYWQIDSYIGGTATGDPIEGDVFTFFTTDDFPPTVDAGPDKVSWDSEVTQIDGTVDDDGTSELTIEWTSDNEAVVFSATDIANPTITLANDTEGPITVILTLAAYDVQNPDPVIDTVTVTVYQNACAATLVGAGKAADYPGDFNDDCIIDLADFALEIASKWMDDYTLTEPIPAN